MRNVKNNIYVGDREDANDTEMLNQKGINTVITLNQELVCDSAEMNKRSYRMYPLLDGGNNPQSQVDAAVFDVAGEIESGNKFLIHCAMGMSRSPSILAGAMALVDEKSFDESLDFLKERYEPAKPNPEIVKQVKKSVSRFRGD